MEYSKNDTERMFERLLGPATCDDHDHDPTGVCSIPENDKREIRGLE